MKKTMSKKILSPLRRDGYKAGMIMMLIALSTMLLAMASPVPRILTMVMVQERSASTRATSCLSWVLNMAMACQVGFTAH